MHAASEMSAGDELLRSYLGAAITQPLPQREAELAESGWPGIESGTQRGKLEARVSDNVRGVLQVSGGGLRCAGCASLGVYSRAGLGLDLALLGAKAQVLNSVQGILQVSSTSSTAHHP